MSEKTSEKDDGKKTKLVLKKQVLRSLTELQLQAVAGGRIVTSEPHGVPYPQ